MTPATITEAEQVAEERAAAALGYSRIHAKGIVSQLRPVSKSPLFGNGLHRGLVSAVEAADALDNALENLQKLLHDHFHGGDE